MLLRFGLLLALTRTPLPDQKRVDAIRTAWAAMQMQKASGNLREESKEIPSCGWSTYPFSVERYSKADKTTLLVVDRVGPDDSNQHDEYFYLNDELVFVVSVSSLEETLPQESRFYLWHGRPILKTRKAGKGRAKEEVESQDDGSLTDLKERATQVLDSFRSQPECLD